MHKHTSRSEIVEILCRRDGCTFGEAMQRIDDTISMMEDVCFDPNICDGILACELGLEMDYIFDLLL